MTTRSSPIQILKAQADRMAAVIKGRRKDTCKAAVCMDDKTIVLELTGVLEMDEKALAKYILDKMQE